MTVYAYLLRPGDIAERTFGDSLVPTRFLVLRQASLHDAMFNIVPGDKWCLLLNDDNMTSHRLVLSECKVKLLVRAK